MAKQPRAIAPDVPHHVIQRGNRRQRTFFVDDDYIAYLELLTKHCAANEVSVWAWCLMPNHIHLVAVPKSGFGLSKAMGDTHRRFSWAINRLHQWRGSLWQDRFRCCAMDESHTLTAMRYVERNPDRAHLTKRPEDWPWSSARAHLGLPSKIPGGDQLTNLVASQSLIQDWQSFLNEELQSGQLDLLRQSTGTGRPIGNPEFITGLELKLGRKLRPNKRGPLPKRLVNGG